MPWGVKLPADYMHFADALDGVRILFRWGGLNPLGCALGNSLMGKHQSCTLAYGGSNPPSSTTELS